MSTEAELNLDRFVPKVHYELIPIKNLVSNQEYQRNLSQKHVEKAAAHFDICQVNPVKVSRRDGINYVFNGQHTIEIIALISGSRETPVWCMIYDDLIYEREADIFANQMKYTKPLLPYEIFMANIEAGNDKQLIIKELVESYSLEITGNAQPGGICAVSTLELIYDKYGLKCLDRVLRLCVATWEGAPQSLTANMMNGIARVVVAYGETIKDELFKERLGKISLKELSRTARDRRAGSLGYAEAIVTYYNKRTHAALSMEKLYTHNNRKKEPAADPDEETEEYEQAELDLRSEINARVKKPEKGDGPGKNGEDDRKPVDKNDTDENIDLTAEEMVLRRFSEMNGGPAEEVDHAGKAAAG